MFPKSKSKTNSIIFTVMPIYANYANSNYLYTLIMVFKRISDNFAHFSMNLYNIMYENGFGEKQILNFVKLVNHIYDFNEYDKSISKDTKQLEIQKYKKIKELDNVDKEIISAKQMLDNLNLEVKVTCPMKYFWCSILF